MDNEGKNKKFGMAIKTAMIRADLKHKDLIELIAKRKGVRISKGTLSHWISGKNTPTRENLAILCDILDLNPSDYTMYKSEVKLVYKVNTRAPWYKSVNTLIKHLKSNKKSDIYKVIPSDIAQSFKDDTARILHTELSIFGSMREVTLYIDTSKNEPSAGFYLLEIGAFKGIRELRVDPVTENIIVIDLESRGGTEEYIVHESLPYTIYGRAEFINIKI